MKYFTIKLLLFLAPFLIPVTIYVLMDPFLVLYNHAEQINTDKDYQITNNRDFQSTQLFLRSYKQNGYNSFIFGNSRSLFYRVSIWDRYIDGNPFHFDASSESLYGIYHKFKLLDDLKADIKNALIVIDVSVLSETRNSTGHLAIKHPALSGQSNLSFQIEMFRGYFPKAIFAYTDLFFTGKRKNYMMNYGIIDNRWKHDTRTNELTYFALDDMIKNNADSFYAKRIRKFYKRDSVQHISEPSIHKDQITMLNGIQAILKSHHTKYKIIVSPLYNQEKISSQDINYLKGLFGNENVFDFSGINSFTNDYHNYYETEHYRPFICDSILNIIYK